MVRAGRTGEHERRFFDDSKVYLTWDGLRTDLSGVRTQEEVRQVLDATYPNESNGRLVNWTGQVWNFVVPMKIGDWVALPRKTTRAIAFAEITGGYTFDASAPSPYNHSRKVRWLTQDVPRSAFDQDILFSLGAFMTVCQISRNDAEKRVRAMAERGWGHDSGTTGNHKTSKPSADELPAQPVETADLEQLARDEIAKVIGRRFKGHAMATLVDAILKAQGYTTFTSPPGPDKGVDILAAPGALGFGRPRICVQVKSQESPVDTPTLHQLVGSMQNVGADQGLLVAWGGFKSSVDRETPSQFFRVRLWDQDDLIDQLLEHYEKLPEDLRAELPLKRIWTVAREDND